MILIDYSQVVISNLMAEIGTRTDIPIDVNLLRHMVINTIRSHKLKFEGEYGEVVIACDSKNYWRKQVFPYYKANRKKAREDSKLDWAAIFDAINLIKEELKAIFPYKVIEVEGTEADDVIASIVYWSLNNDMAEGTLFPSPKPLLIISGDHDFNQLQRYKHVKQFSPVHKKFIKLETSADKTVLEHVIRGDKGDGVPNVLSGDNCIVSGERQKSISSKKLEEWLNDPSTMPTDVTFVRNFHRNRALVDLSLIPKDIQERIINTFTTYPKKGRSHLLNYFISNKMKQMIEHIEEI